MKYYVAGKLLNRVEDQEYVLLFGVTIIFHKRGWIKRDDWGAGWIYDADDSFRSWCAIAYGFVPAIITDDEFRLLENDGVVYLSKDRTVELKTSVMSQLSLIAVNS